MPALPPNNRTRVGGRLQLPFTFYFIHFSILGILYTEHVLFLHIFFKKAINRRTALLLLCGASWAHLVRREPPACVIPHRGRRSSRPTAVPPARRTWSAPRWSRVASCGRWSCGSPCSGNTWTAPGPADTHTSVRQRTPDRRPGPCLPDRKPGTSNRCSNAVQAVCRLLNSMEMDVLKPGRCDSLHLFH